MRSLGHEWTAEDLAARQSAVMVYGIVSTILGVIALIFIFFCSMCNFVAPIAMLSGAMALLRGREVIRPLAEAKMNDSQAVTGLVTGAVGFFMGLIALLWMVVTGFIMGLYVAFIGLLIANAP